MKQPGACRHLTTDCRSARSKVDTEAVEVIRGHITEGFNGQAKEVRSFLSVLEAREDLPPETGMTRGQVKGDG